MSQPIRSKLYREVEDLLQATGLHWSIEDGSKHNIVTLAGERVGILSHGRKTGCDSKKIASTIRQTIKRLEQA